MTERPCPCRCGTRGFCEPHRALLAQIKEDLKGANRKAGRKMTIAGTRGIAHEYEEDDTE